MQPRGGKKLNQLKSVQMASGIEFEEDSENKGSMWVLDQKLDQPMDEEAGRLRNMYREKVTQFNSLINFLSFSYVDRLRLAVFFWSCY